MNRRELLKGLAVVPVAAATTLRVWAEDADPAGKVVEYPFVQNASGVSLKDGRLTLKAHHNGRRHVAAV